MMWDAQQLTAYIVLQCIIDAHCPPVTSSTRVTFNTLLHHETCKSTYLKVQNKFLCDEQDKIGSEHHTCYSSVLLTSLYFLTPLHEFVSAHDGGFDLLNNQM